MQEPVEVGRERDSLDKKLDIQGVPVHLEAVASVATTCTGLELAWVPRVPGTRQDSEHHLAPAPADFEVLSTNWHPQFQIPNSSPAATRMERIYSEFTYANILFKADSYS